MTSTSPIPLGRLGVWLGSLALTSWAEERDAARTLEASGFGTLWYSESHLTREAMSHGTLLLGATDTIAVASGIASIWARDAISAANASASLQDAYPDRFLLGLGVSHAPLVAQRGQAYDRPLSAMREYLDAMDASRGFGPVDPRRRILGALGPKMLELARARACGAHPYLVTSAHTASARALLGDSVLAPEQGFVIERDPGRARTIARDHLRTYLRLENYRTSWRRLGFSDQDFDEGGSDRLVDELIAWGEPEQVAAKINAHFEAGADHVAAQALGPDPLGQLRELATVAINA